MAVIHPQELIGNWHSGVALDVHTVSSVHDDILLFDDLFRSGATLRAITEVLMQQGQAFTVRVLTLTKTRRNQ